MAQGLEWDKEKIIEVLKPYLQLGYSLNKSCVLAQIPYTTVFTWFDKEPELRIKFKAWQNMASAKARENVVAAIAPKGGGMGDAELSKWWLERREKKEFSPRQEVTGPRGTPIYDLSKETLEKVQEFEDLDESEDYEEENTDV